MWEAERSSRWDAGDGLSQQPPVPQGPTTLASPLFESSQPGSKLRNLKHKFICMLLAVPRDSFPKCCLRFATQACSLPLPATIITDQEFKVQGPEPQQLESLSRFYSIRALNSSRGLFIRRLVPEIIQILDKSILSPLSLSK